MPLYSFEAIGATLLLRGHRCHVLYSFEAIGARPSVPLTFRGLHRSTSSHPGQPSSAAIALYDHLATVGSTRHLRRLHVTCVTATAPSFAT